MFSPPWVVNGVRLVYPSHMSQQQEPTVPRPVAILLAAICGVIGIAAGSFSPPKSTPSSAPANSGVGGVRCPCDVGMTCEFLSETEGTLTTCKIARVEVSTVGSTKVVRTP